MAENDGFGKSIIGAAPIDAPDVTARLLRTLVGFAIDGTDWFPGARAAAGKQLQNKGSVEAAISSVTTGHVTLSGAQGFVTNLGGIATLIIGAPANLAGVALVQTRMVAAIAHLRGYDLDDSRVRHAVVTTLLGQRIVDELVAHGDLPGSPLVLATAPGIDYRLEQLISQRVMTALLTSTGGKQAIGLVAKRIPVIGGGVGAATDSWNTAAIARYTRAQFVSRRGSR
ncbi:EcsC family protein [Propionimicrobium sp. PCR01-08-3]|uniref:EcsC family protein n=1 Tax=Propionimicrobium sp. PCR01-08-3 TaxID=3052086 RepID=UPI00255C68BA|nr:EcsC family protein [Propionimicrobium sp. PCR01-08-3]WIY82705.1 EcsC family protein [Propionimicrobium sp. PCR01-08-3]